MLIYYYIYCSRIFDKTDLLLIFVYYVFQFWYTLIENTRRYEILLWFLERKNIRRHYTYYNWFGCENWVCKNKPTCVYLKSNPLSKVYIIHLINNNIINIIYVNQSLPHCFHYYYNRYFTLKWSAKDWEKYLYYFLEVPTITNTTNAHTVDERNIMFSIEDQPWTARTILLYYLHII